MDIYSNHFCVYLTCYRGNKLPPFYIGSSSVERVKNGYKGSVQSKKYKQTWNKELKENPHLFSTKIICTHKTRKEALSKEDFLQRSLNVVDSLLYINLSFAQKEGCFGLKSQKNRNPVSENGKKNMKLGWIKRKENGFTSWNKGLKNDSRCISGANKAAQTRKRNGSYIAWNKGKKLTEEQKKNLKGKIRSEEHKQNISKAKKGKTAKNKGIPMREQQKAKISKTKTGVSQKIVTCPVCSKSGGITNMFRYHFDNCKEAPGNENIKFTYKPTIVACPICGKEGSKNNMSRYHFDNCKNKLS